MKKLFLFCLFLASALQTVHSQLTLRVTAIPINTPQGANIHAAGTFNNWNPGDPATILTPSGTGQYQITLNPTPGEVKFKFTRGSWATVEGNANGGFLPDRIVNYNGQPTTIDLTILSWEDLGGTGGNGTAAPNVVLLDNDFYIPQLDRYRKIWIYLPPDYNTTAKKYPVLYMHDGQNLFDQNTSAFGEWEVDESLNTLHAQGDWGCIVVGIENDGQFRLDEYSPWVNPQYGGGQGDEYLSFLVNTLKPYIDANYRTLPGRLTTAIAGSSMGGLISMYAFSERQDIFSKAGIFSPAFWFADNEPVNHVASHLKQGSARVYFLAGADEENNGNQSNYVVEDMQAVADAMTTAGFTPSEKSFNVISDGKHSEWFWAREFPDAYEWLFADFTTGSNEPSTLKSTLEIYPNPSQNWIYFSGIPENSALELEIFRADGTLLQQSKQSATEPFWTGDLPAGFYLVKALIPDEGWKTAPFIRP
ncbi:MAG: T9SS type A sorting domain-containing protein [Chitinophagales bacterium]|nr:T9SS type A sorting domain-containing protein [Chitinophagales bacterium]